MKRLGWESGWWWKSDLNDEAIWMCESNLDAKSNLNDEATWMQIELGYESEWESNLNKNLIWMMRI